MCSEIFLITSKQVFHVGLFNSEAELDRQEVITDECHKQDEIIDDRLDIFRVEIL